MEGPCIAFNQYRDPQLSVATEADVQDLLMSTPAQGLHRMFQMRGGDLMVIEGKAVVVHDLMGHGDRLLLSTFVCAYVFPEDWTPVLLLEIVSSVTDVHVFKSVFRERGSGKLRGFVQKELQLDTRSLLLCLAENAEWHPLPPALARAMAERHRA